MLLRRVEFGSNTTEKFKISRGATEWDFKFFCGVWKPKFQIPLSAEACLQLTPRHLWNWTKICGVWVKHHSFFKIPQILSGWFWWRGVLEEKLKNVRTPLGVILPNWFHPAAALWWSQYKLQHFSSDRGLPGIWYMESILWTHMNVCPCLLV